MALKIVLTEQAAADFVEIREYVLLRSAAGADSVREAIYHTLATVASFPLVGRTKKNAWISVNVPKYPYCIYYGTDGATLTVYHIRHGRRRGLE